MLLLQQSAQGALQVLDLLGSLLEELVALVGQGLVCLQQVVVRSCQPIEALSQREHLLPGLLKLSLCSCTIACCSAVREVAAIAALTLREASSQGERAQPRSASTLC